MKLTQTERMILANQSRILEALYPDEAEYYSRAYRVLTAGYEGAYEWYLPDLYPPNEMLSEAECLEVIDILTMFRILKHAYSELEDKSGINSSRLEYKGFDGNEERQFGFASFLKSEDKFTELKGSDGDNSHCPMMGRYRVMLQEWKSSPDPYELTKDDLLRIAQS